MQRSIVLLLHIAFFVSVLLLFKNQLMVYAQTPSNSQKQIYFEGKIESINDSKNGKQLTVVGTSGAFKDKKLQVPLMEDEKTKQLSYEINDKVILLRTESPNQPPVTYIVDFVRTTPLIILTLLFILIVCAVGKLHGVLSIISMIYSFLILGQFVVPNIVVGNDPIFVSIMAGMLISPVTFYLSHGFNKKTTVAIIGTLASLVLTGILSIIFVNLAKLTGITSDEALYVKALVNQDINLKSLLLAGMIIGLLGILDDITVSQAAIVEKLIKTSEKMDIKDIFIHAMDIGKDHIASLVNTLVLVYAGASLPLFLLFFNSGLSYSQALSSEIVATEVVRTLIGSIGLVAAVPLTTLLACLFMKKK